MTGERLASWFHWLDDLACTVPGERVFVRRAGVPGSYVPDVRMYGRVHVAVESLREAVDVVLDWLDTKISSYCRVPDVSRGCGDFSECLVLLALDLFPSVGLH